MGSFYSTCAISDLSIVEEEDMVFQFIVPSASMTLKWNKSYMDADDEFITSIFGKGLFCKNDISQSIYSPFGFPIFGTYNDYGRIQITDDSSKHRQIKLIEDFFNLSIEDVMNAANRFDDYNQEILEKKTLDGTEIKNKEILKDLTFTHYHRKVYDKMIKMGIEESKGDYYFFNGKTLDSYMTEICEILDNYIIFNDLYEQGKVHPNNDFEYYDNNNKFRVKEKLYITNLCRTIFLTELLIDSSYKEEITEQYILLRQLEQMWKYLRPSTYGGQEDNFMSFKDLIPVMSEVIEDKTKKWNDECGEGEEI